MAAGGGSSLDPTEQFSVHDIVPIHLFGHDFSFTNASLYMFIVVAAVTGLMILAVSREALVPGRLQSVAEMAYEFNADMLRSSTGQGGMHFLPLVFTIFMFTLFANVISLIPFTFSVTAQVIVTSVLALLVFFLVIFTGIKRNGGHFFQLFVPKGVPIYILPLVVGIEIISFLSRPVSHSVRLFANMLAGHITLQVFGGFVLMLLGAGAWAVISPLPFLMTVAMFALELLVAFLQAYVFTMLTCMYLNDALHPVH
ncbi:ATP synthase subunit a [Beijerinckiaceae bacterium RH AL1]|nr:F0F1 ATP synthase subunit A [Beijerinckiaceae bacterium]VVB44202.1 ATP synthase subunit a [Beijerinckiaceae bacterium RH CH11]VVB44231.1 ATP synthase subunit a [Beijerinckiaceae bacterium RH AL8]VVC54222.1 ATP synthase subunit a [Beijerinckiaceae bacterium RH AL1]